MTSTNNNTSISAQVDERKKKWGGDIYSFDAYANKDKYQDYGFNSVEDYMASYNNDMDYVTRFDTATLAKQEAEEAARKTESQQLQYADTRRQLMEKYIPETLLAQGIANTGYTADALLKAENNYNQYATNAMNTRAETEQNILKDYQTTLKNMQKDYADTAYKNFLEQNTREEEAIKDQTALYNDMATLIDKGFTWEQVEQLGRNNGATDDTIGKAAEYFGVVEGIRGKETVEQEKATQTSLYNKAIEYIESEEVEWSWDELNDFLSMNGANEDTIQAVKNYYDRAIVEGMYNNYITLFDTDNLTVGDVDKAERNGLITAEQAASLRAKVNGDASHITVSSDSGRGAFITSAKQYGDGFREAKGDNLVITFDNQQYEVQHNGYAGDGPTNYAKAANVPNNTVFIYEGKVCIRVGDKAYELGGRYWDGSGMKNLLNALNKYYVDTGKASANSLFKNVMDYDEANNVIRVGANSTYTKGDERIYLDDKDVAKVEDKAIIDLAKYYKANEVFMVGDTVYIKRSDGTISSVKDDEVNNFIKRFVKG